MSVNAVDLQVTRFSVVGLQVTRFSTANHLDKSFRSVLQNIASPTRFCFAGFSIMLVSKTQVTTPQGYLLLAPTQNSLSSAPMPQVSCHQPPPHKFLPCWALCHKVLRRRSQGCLSQHSTSQGSSLSASSSPVSKSLATFDGGRYCHIVTFSLSSSLPFLSL